MPKTLMAVNPVKGTSDSTLYGVKTSDYQKLLRDIRREIEKGFQKVEELLERHKVLSHWATGRHINIYLNSHDLPYGGVGRFYEDLSRDLGINNRTLQQCEQFFRYFPRFKPEKYLKWSHYRFLLTVSDEARRQEWIARIKKERIPPDELRLALMPQSVKSDEPPASNLKTPVRGRLFTYRILRAADIENFETPWFVDLGFAARKEAPASKAVLNNKNLYKSEKINGDYLLKTINDARADELFTFRGKLRRVVDADTPLVIIDQGFGYWNEQRLRLKGIDAPELGTLAGERAKKWIENELKDSPNLVVKTYKTDQWDRYLVDVFYLPGETDMHRVAAEGLWLNGRMVEAGVAKVWGGKMS